MAESLVAKSSQEAPTNKTLFSGGPTIKRPTNPAAWLHYFDTDLGYSVIWDGSTWRDGARGFQGMAPQGFIGPQGARGFNGFQGVQGGTGGGGSGGTRGPTGSTGVQGPAGVRGPQGETGSSV